MEDIRLRGGLGLGAIRLLQLLPQLPLTSDLIDFAFLGSMYFAAAVSAFATILALHTAGPEILSDAVHKREDTSSTVIFFFTAEFQLCGEHCLSNFPPSAFHGTWKEEKAFQSAPIPNAHPVFQVSLQKRQRSLAGILLGFIDVEECFGTRSAASCSDIQHIPPFSHKSRIFAL
mmetsp:Transcript_24461/g.56981  ORF Transcript_24461/g.56981 Transcript_24461/m.56981 type:complete len:174 (+) Transcript_24461:3003-3524(+)